MATALLAAIRRFLVVAAFIPAARRFRVLAAFRPAARRFRVVAAFLPAALRFLVTAARLAGDSSTAYSFVNNLATTGGQPKTLPVIKRRLHFRC